MCWSDDHALSTPMDEQQCNAEKLTISMPAPSTAGIVCPVQEHTSPEPPTRPEALTRARCSSPKMGLAKELEAWIVGSRMVSKRSIPPFRASRSNKTQAKAVGQTTTDGIARTWQMR